MLFKVHENFTGILAPWVARMILRCLLWRKKIGKMFNFVLKPARRFRNAENAHDFHRPGALVSNETNKILTFRDGFDTVYSSEKRKKEKAEICFENEEA